MTKLLDANLIVRFLVNDDLKKADAVEKLLRGKEELLLTDVTVAEIIWVMASYYKHSPKKICEEIESLLHLPIIKCNRKTLLCGLEFYREFNIDWIDAYSAAFAIEENIKEIYSYDKDLDKIKVISRIEP